MSFKLKITMLALIAASAAPLAQADESDSHSAQSVYGAIGPFGLSVGYAHRTSAHWVSRLQINTGTLTSPETHSTVSGVRYEAKEKTGVGLSTFTDYYPSTDSGWRLTGGLIISPLKTRITGQPDGQGNYSINDHTYTAAQVGQLTGRLKFNPFNLYLGGGWESAPIETKGWRFMSDVGLFYAGKASARLEASGATTNATLLNDINAERSQLEKKGIGAMISLGAAYSF